MRLPEDRIKEAILSPDRSLRQRAVGYFSRSFSPDPSVMPLVIRAVETHGKEDAFLLVGPARDLAQTADTLTWVIGELNDPRCTEFESYADNLSAVLAGADLALVLPREAEILACKHFVPAYREGLAERLAMRDWDTATCGAKLEEFCEQAKDKEYVNEVNLDHANRIVEALARHGREVEEKVRAILAIKIDDFHNNPLAWLEPLTVRLAGEARLASTVPLLVAKMREEGDLLEGECQRALTRVGGDGVIRAVTEAFPAGNRTFRINATGPLADVHTDLAVEKGVALLARERSREVAFFLGEAVLSQFATEAVEPVRHLLVGRELAWDEKSLRDGLLDLCQLSGQRFPEFDAWAADKAADEEVRRNRAEMFKTDPQRALLDAIGELAGRRGGRDRAAKPAAPRPAPLPKSSLLKTPRADREGRVGRNDPCPCGSGKKFKHCCLNKPKGH